MIIAATKTDLISVPDFCPSFGGQNQHVGHGVQTQDSPPFPESRLSQMTYIGTTVEFY